MNEELSVKNLRDVKEVFDEYCIKYWLDYGTLLGAVRDQRLIPWDTDIDLGADNDSWEKIVLAIPELEKRGFNVLFGDFKIHNDVFQRFVALNRFGDVIGISVYQIKGEYVLFLMTRSPIITGLYVVIQLLSFGEAQVQPKNKFIVGTLERCLSLLPSVSKKPLEGLVKWIWRKTHNVTDRFYVVTPKHYFEKLGTIKLYDMTFNIPSDIEDYLRYHYGEDWKIPKKEWHSAKEDRAFQLGFHK